MDFLTTGQIAKRLNTDRDSVSYALRKTSVEPVGRAGITRVYQESAVEAVRTFLKQKRGGDRHG